MKIIQSLIFALMLVTTSVLADHLKVRYDEHRHSIVVMKEAKVGHNKFEVMLTPNNDVKSVLKNDETITLKAAGFKIVELGDARVLVIGDQNEAIRLK